MARMMKAAFIQGPHRFTVEERPIPSPGSGEILVRTTSCGICTSEIEIWKGKIPDMPYPKCIGHEPSGIVEAVGADVQGFAVGDPVAVWSEGNGFAEYFVSNADYAYNQMKDIATGARNNGQTAAMKGIMHLVSDEELRIIADWLGTLK